MVPTRGQAVALKLACVRANQPLLGVEILTLGLARQRFVSVGDVDAVPVIGRELLLFGLKALIAEEIAAKSDQPTGDQRDEATGLLVSLSSDIERALEDFDKLLAAGLGADAFPDPEVSAVFRRLEVWVSTLGYRLAGRCDSCARTALTASAAGGSPRRLMAWGFGADHWQESDELAALSKSFEMTCVLPAPEFGASDADERWIQNWEKLLGVESVALDDDSDANSGAFSADLWNKTGAEAARGGSAAEILVGLSPSDQAELIADQVCQWLEQPPADRIAVIFPSGSRLHRRVAEILSERAVAFFDAIGLTGTVSEDARVQKALLNYFGNGERIDELLELWAVLRPLNLVGASLGEARRYCEDLWDEVQEHGIAAYRGKIGIARAGGAGPALAQLVNRLTAWPRELTISDALERFESLCSTFGIAEPAGWDVLRHFAGVEERRFGAAEVAALLTSFLPRQSRTASAPTVFSRVTLTTHRRAASIAWSHVILAEANAELWPKPAAQSPWLTDDAIWRLNEGRAQGLVMTSEDRLAIDRAALASIARNTECAIVFSAALLDEKDPETRLSPNGWMERVLWSQHSDSGDWSLEAEFARSAVLHHDPEVEDPAVLRWRSIWLGRRDPERPFDEYFYSADPAKVRPRRLSARLVERGFADPVEFWYDAILRVSRVNWRPFRRARRKTLGLQVHRLLAASLGAGAGSSEFQDFPPPELCRSRLDVALAEWRLNRPDDVYWTSYYLELRRCAETLLDWTLAHGARRRVLTEFSLPAGLRVPVPGIAGAALEVSGRMDLVLSDAAGWSGGAVDVVDFKTGSDSALSLRRMQDHGDSLQLGLYLAAAGVLGATDARVWLVKPEADGESSLSLDRIHEMLAPLRRVWRHLETGKYGQTSADRALFEEPRPLPLACTPIRQSVLLQKLARTFGPGEES